MHLSAIANRQSGKHEGDERDDDRSRQKENAQAELAQLMVEKMRSELVPVAEAEKAWTGIAKRIRAACTALQPTLVACAGLTEAQAKVVRTAIREVLAEIG